MSAAHPAMDSLAMIRYAKLKRGFDFAASFLIVVVLIPLLLILMLAIRAESKGSPIFVQKRLGIDKKPFNCLKLRTMYLTAPEVSFHQLPPNYITKLGHFLRKSKLDELPQLINVLRGDMSLVGPRPCLPSQDILIRERDELNVFQIKPGITGLAQIQGVGTEDASEQARLDKEYISTLSFLGDIKIFLITICGRWKKNG